MLDQYVLAGRRRARERQVEAQTGNSALLDALALRQARSEAEDVGEIARTAELVNLLGGGQETSLTSQAVGVERAGMSRQLENLLTPAEVEQALMVGQRPKPSVYEMAARAGLL